MSEDFSAAEAEARKRREKILLKRKVLLKQNTVAVEVTQQTVKEEEVSRIVERSDNAHVEDKTALGGLQERLKNENQSCELVYRQNGKGLVKFSDVSRVASRKVDWDLKKGIEKSLAALQDRTNEVIVQIVKEQMDYEEADE